MTIKRILFPFDFSDQGFLAGRFVRAAAERFGARVTLFSTIPPVWEVADTQQMGQDLQSRLDAALIDELAGLDVERITSLGDPNLKIVEFAHANEVDLIIMPTHGLGFFRTSLIGSVTAKVLHDARCPVWTATHAEEQSARHLPQKVLCAVDGTEGSPALIQWAGEFSKQMEASLRLLHVVPPISDWLALSSERELQEQLREEARSKLIFQESSGVDVPVRIAAGPIAATVAEEARQEGADLVVIGRGSLHSPLGRLRTHAYGIIQKSPCPVLSV
jgi:nucleotide-binding universal stress UspA family protein